MADETKGLDYNTVTKKANIGWNETSEFIT